MVDATCRLQSRFQEIITKNTRKGFLQTLRKTKQIQSEKRKQLIANRTTQQRLIYHFSSNLYEEGVN